MKKVLVLGAGLVSRPLVEYLLSHPDFEVTVASRTVSKAENLVGKHPRGKAQALAISNATALKQAIAGCDLAISLVPYTHHVQIAEFCLELKKDMITTSYVSPAMRALDGRARQAGILILNEIGLDPGIDHMSAMRIIHGVQHQGGEIASFFSYCGGLPAPEANTNPFGYKFSWSPRGVVMAGRNTGRYLKDGKEVHVPGPDLFAHYWTIDIEGLTTFEAYPNRDSIPYVETYGITSTRSMYRGTLRNRGWCDTWKKMVDLGLLDDAEMSGLAGLSYGGFIARLIGKSPGPDLMREAATWLKIAEDAEPIKKMDWLGLFGNDPLPCEKSSPMDVLGGRLLEKLQYREGERDMIVLHHEFRAEYPKGRKERITSTLIDFGIPRGDSAMSRTVSLPAAIAARLMLEGRIKETGVHIPVNPLIYEPVLDELARVNITCKEKTYPLS
jgi:saccharopine dehydrogenase-like NADP-dependent oxidoreductase